MNISNDELELMIEKTTNQPPTVQNEELWWYLYNSKRRGLR